MKPLLFLLWAQGRAVVRRIVAVSAVCHRCGTSFERPWPGDRPAICPHCPVVIVLLWRFVDESDLPVLKADARQLQEWFAR